MSPAVNSAEFLHKQMENVCSHREVTRDPPPLFIQKNFLLCRKIFDYAENFSIMQKNKNYAESFLVCRKIFFDYAKKKISSCAKKKKKTLSMNLFFYKDNVHS